VGGVQSLISQLLHVTLGETEQSMSTLPAGMGSSTNWKVTGSAKAVVTVDWILSLSADYGN